MALKRWPSHSDSGITRSVCTATWTLSPLAEVFADAKDLSEALEEKMIGSLPSAPPHRSTTKRTTCLTARQMRVPWMSPMETLDSDSLQASRRLTA